MLNIWVTEKTQLAACVCGDAQTVFKNVSYCLVVSKISLIQLQKINTGVAGHHCYIEYLARYLIVKLHKGRDKVGERRGHEVNILTAIITLRNQKYNPELIVVIR